MPGHNSELVVEAELLGVFTMSWDSVMVKVKDTNNNLLPVLLPEQVERQDPS